MIKKILPLLLIGTLPSWSFASAVLENTRIIYSADRDGKTVKITNNDPTPYIIQLWSDRGDEKSTPTDADAPFVALPPSFKMSPDSVQTVKLIYSGQPLAQDRESIFYFNMVQVPPVKQNQNAMALVLKNRVKIFYRPTGLPAPSSQTLEQGLSFTPAARGGVTVTNASPYYVSTISATLSCAGVQTSLNADMVAPKSSGTRWSGKRAAQSGCTVNYTYINDYGGQIKAGVKTL